MNKVHTQRKSLRVLFLLSLTLILLISLTGCRKENGELKPVAASEFQKIAEGLGYKIYDITNQYSYSPPIKRCVGFEVKGFHFEFFEIDSKENTIEFFEINKAGFEKNKTSGSTEVNINDDTQNLYTLKTNETYYYVQQVGTTAVFAYCPIGSSADLEKVIKAINY